MRSTPAALTISEKAAKRLLRSYPEACLRVAYDDPKG